MYSLPWRTNIRSVASPTSITVAVANHPPAARPIPIYPPSLSCTTRLNRSTIPSTEHLSIPRIPFSLRLPQCVPLLERRFLPISSRFVRFDSRLNERAETLGCSVKHSDSLGVMSWLVTNSFE